MDCKTALVIVDVQNDYFPGGKFPLVNSESALKNVQGLLKNGRRKKWMIVHVQHICIEPEPEFFLPNTDGVKIHASLMPLPDEHVIIKHTPDSFFGTELEEILKNAGIEHLVICGMMSNHCIDSTVRSAQLRGYEITLIQDACSACDLKFQGETIPGELVHKIFMAGLQEFSEVTDYSLFMDNLRP